MKDASGFVCVPDSLNICAENVHCLQYLQHAQLRIDLSTIVDLALAIESLAIVLRISHAGFDRFCSLVLRISHAELDQNSYIDDSTELSSLPNNREHVLIQ